MIRAALLLALALSAPVKAQHGNPHNTPTPTVVPNVTIGVYFGIGATGGESVSVAVNGVARPPCTTITATCNYSVPAGSSLRVQAFNGTASTFSYWTTNDFGVACNTNPCSIRVPNGNASLSANYVPQ